MFNKNCIARGLQVSYLWIAEAKLAVFGLVENIWAANLNAFNEDSMILCRKISLSMGSWVHKKVCWPVSYYKLILPKIQWFLASELTFKICASSSVGCSINFQLNVLLYDSDNLHSNF